MNDDTDTQSIAGIIADVVKWRQAMNVQKGVSEQRGQGGFLTEEVKELYRELTIWPADHPGSLAEWFDVIFAGLDHYLEHYTPEQIDAAWQAFMSAQHTKQPTKDGSKVAKGPNYKRADLAAILNGESGVAK